MYLYTKDGYTIESKPSQNKIIINLPQTPTTAMNTMLPIEDRKSDLSEGELATVLNMIRCMYRGNYHASKE